MTNSPFFRERAIILFLNKTDLFAQKIQYSDLRQLFPEYVGGPNYEAACGFIRDRFLERSRSGAKVCSSTSPADPSASFRPFITTCLSSLLFRYASLCL